MEPPDSEIPIETQVPDESLDHTGHPSTPKDSIPEQSGVSEPSEQNGKPVVPEPQQFPIGSIPRNNNKDPYGNEASSTQVLCI